MKTMKERFYEKVATPDANGCMLWTGAVHKLHGYGRFRTADRTTRQAHRVAYKLLVGPIPAGLHIDHLCRVRHCVAPAHLEPVTHRVNVLRGVAPAARHARVTQCPAGHAYSAENTRVTPLGTRKCRACHRARERQRREAGAAR